MDSLRTRHKVTLNRDGYDRPEKNDCTVSAIQNVTGVPYIDAHEFQRKHGRRDKHGISMSGVLYNAAIHKEIIYGYRVRRVDKAIQPFGGYSSFKAERKTLAAWMPRLRKGRFVVVISEHTFAVIDGVIYDSGYNGARCRVHSVWEFEPSSVVEAREAAERDGQ